MSWDIFVMDLPPVEKVSDIPDDFKPGQLGPRVSIIEKIVEVVPDADFSDPTWGMIEGETYSIEVNVGRDDPVTSFAFHVRGGDAAADVVAGILEHLGLRAVDAQTGEFFTRSDASESFAAWRQFRDAVVNDNDDESSV